MPAMEKVIRDVADIDAADRQALAHVIGKHLAEHQQVIILQQAQRRSSGSGVASHTRTVRSLAAVIRR